MAAKPLNRAFTQAVREKLDAWRRGEISREEFLKQLEHARQQVPEENKHSHLGHLETYIGVFYGYEGQLEQSSKHFEAAERHFRLNHDEHRLLDTQLNLGEAYRLMGNYQQAIRSFKVCYELACKKESLNNQTLAQANQAIVYVEMGNYKQARSNLERAVELASIPWQTPETAPQHRLSARCEIYCTYAHLEMLEGNLSVAWERAKQALEQAQEVNEPYRFGQTYAIMAQVVEAYGKAPEDGYQDQPDSYFQQSIEHFDRIKSERELANVYLIYGKSLAQRNKEDEAREAYTQAIAIFARLGLPKLTAQAAEARAALGRR